jgi:hypothetical protein
MRAGEREKAYESQFDKKTTTTPTPVKKQTEQPTLLQTLITTLGGVITTGLTSLATVINGSLTTLGSVIKGALELLGNMLLARSIANQLPIPGGDIPDADRKEKPNKPGEKQQPKKDSGKGASGRGGKGGIGAGSLKGLINPLSVGLGLATYSSEVGVGSDKVPGRENSPTPEKTFDYEKYKELVAKEESGNNYKIDNKVGFLGKYQFGAQALETYGYLKKGTSKGNGYLKKGTSKGNDNAVYDPNNWTGKDGIKNKEDFLNNPSVQEEMMKKYTKSNFDQLVKSGVLTPELSGADIASRLYAAHHGGVGGANALFLKGESRGDKYLSGASTGKSAEKMASLYSGGSVPSGAGISSGSVAIAANQNLPNAGTQVIDNKTINNNTQAGGGGAGTQVTAYDSDMVKYLLRPVS